MYYSYILLGQLNFYVEMLIPLLILMRRQERRSLFALRLLLVVAVGAGLAFMPELNVGQFGMHYLIVMGVAFLAGWFIFDVSPLDVLFYTIAAFAVQHCLWDILFIVFETIGELTQAAALVIYFSLYLVAYALFWLFFPVSELNEGGVKGRGLQFAVSAFIIAFVYVIASLVPWLYSWNILYRLYALICCIFALGLQCGLFEHTKLKEKNRELERDKFVLEELLMREQKQYAITKDTIDLINIKCHDLKHQLAMLEQRYGREELGDIRRAVDAYDSFFHTGNQALDAVLTLKKLICEDKRIELTCLVDGGALSFMSDSDVYSLFGNILDNAVEAVEKLDDKRRVISVTVRRQNNFVVLHEENYCAGPLNFSDGLPETTKDDKLYHGFGLFSVRMLAEKYGGTCSVGAENGVFTVDMLFPVEG